MGNLQISHTYFESFVRETEVSAEASKVRKNQLGKGKRMSQQTEDVNARHMDAWYIQRTRRPVWGRQWDEARLG